jgi:sarcosine oxidase subunit gamma
MNVSITRIDATTFEIMAMRSMAQTLVHELEQAMRGVAARG